jgi:hypothetical protein
MLYEVPAVEVSRLRTHNYIQLQLCQLIFRLVFIPFEKAVKSDFDSHLNRKSRLRSTNDFPVSADLQSVPTSESRQHKKTKRYLLGFFVFYNLLSQLSGDMDV